MNRGRMTTARARRARCAQRLRRVVPVRELVVRHNPARCKRWAYISLCMSRRLLDKMLLTTDSALKMAEYVRFGVESVITASATKNDWSCIFDAINVIEQLVVYGDCSGLDEIEGLQDLIETLLNRRKGGTLALYAHEIARLRQFSADYAAVLDGVPYGRYLLAYEAASQRIYRARRYAGAGDRVIDAESIG